MNNKVALAFLIRTWAMTRSSLVFLVLALAFFAGLGADEIRNFHSSWLRRGALAVGGGPFGATRVVPIPRWLERRIRSAALDCAKGYIFGATREERRDLVDAAVRWLYIKTGLSLHDLRLCCVQRKVRACGLSAREYLGGAVVPDLGHPPIPLPRWLGRHFEKRHGNN